MYENFISLLWKLLTIILLNFVTQIQVIQGFFKIILISLICILKKVFIYTIH